MYKLIDAFYLDRLNFISSTFRKRCVGYYCKEIRTAILKKNIQHRKESSKK